MISSAYFGAAQTLQQRAAMFQAAKAAGYSSIQAQQAAQGQAASRPSSASAPAQLQNALKALGVLAGDPMLMHIKVDGIIGPATVKAVNYAIGHVTGPLKYFEKPNMNVGNVRQYAGGLAATITTYIQQRGGTVPPAVVTAAAHHASGGGASVMTSPTPDPEPDRKWIWWAVAGGSLLLILTMAAHATKTTATVRRKHGAATTATA